MLVVRVLYMFDLIGSDLNSILPKEQGDPGMRRSDYNSDGSLGSRQYIRSKRT